MIGKIPAIDFPYFTTHQLTKICRVDKHIPLIIDAWTDKQHFPVTSPVASSDWSCQLIWKRAAAAGREIRKKMNIKYWTTEARNEFADIRTRNCKYLIYELRQGLKNGTQKSNPHMMMYNARIPAIALVWILNAFPIEYTRCCWFGGMSVGHGLFALLF